MDLYPARHFLTKLARGGLLGAVFLSGAWAASEKAIPDDLIGLDFQNLSILKVTSVSKQEERFMDSAAAIYVITSEDIRRSGATTIAEALRLAPGLDVARTASSGWAISSRGFNGATANKLLVMIDNRSVYSPLFSGVFWDAQDVVLDDIDRIEVIRGPGAAVWGSNAVNGVINIIRKPAADTQGGRLIAGGGTEEKAFGSLRYGGTLGTKGFYRASGKYSQRDNMASATTSGPSNDKSEFAQAGFRADVDASETDSYLLSSDAYTGEADQTTPINSLTPPYRVLHDDETYIAGGNVLASWTRNFSEHSNISVQTYYDHTLRRIHPIFSETRDTYDIEMQNAFPIGGRQNFIWGTGARVSDDRVSDRLGLNFTKNSDLLQNYNFFFQDEIKLHRKFILTVGSKFEYQDYVGLEVQPNLRGAWLINPENTLWGSVSRAVRTPTRIDRDIRVTAISSTSPYTATSFRGSESFQSEELIAYETGWRSKPSEHTFFDITGFYNVYDSLMSNTLRPPFAAVTVPGLTVEPTDFDNKAQGESYGFEMAPQAQLTDWWKMQLQYSYLHLRLHVDSDSFENLNAPTPPTEDNNPEHQAAWRNAFNLPHNFEFDAALRYVDNLPHLNVHSYTVADLRLGWRGIRNMNFDVIAQNLMKPRHREFSPGNEVEQSVYGRVTWDF